MASRSSLKYQKADPDKPRGAAEICRSTVVKVFPSTIASFIRPKSIITLSVTQRMYYTPCPLFLANRMRH